MTRLKLVVSLMMADNAYQQEQASAAQEAASPCEVDVQVIFNDDGLAQGQHLLEMIQSKDRILDGIVCQPVGTALTQVAREAATRGIGWVLLNRNGDYISELRKTYPTPVFGIGVDQEEIGRIHSRQLAHLLPQGGWYCTSPALQRIRP